MKIAILGWGSLIWNPGNLEIDNTNGKNGWLPDGPMLPIEFARISKDGRLTLVIVPGREEVRTLFAISNFVELDHAILDLACREECPKSRIGYFVKSDGHSQSKFKIQNNIEPWIKQKDEIDAVIWTDLSMNFKEKINLEFTEDNAINYLRYLPNEIKIKAEQYIRRAPSIIDTSLRKIIEKDFNWLKIE